ncbi:hypothetical protein FRB91_008822 [Serendipita sp. 411]|nr:hypothetical protein FRB91_008822 [Serendipita sp. 411]KAG8870635.1 hypothetical protein FRC20_011513 [Serendipita sp. 405]
MSRPSSPDPAALSKAKGKDRPRSRTASISPPAKPYPPIRYEAESRFEALSKQPLDDSTFGHWFQELDNALLSARVKMVLLSSRAGVRVQRPSDPVARDHYDEANTAAAEWIALASKHGNDHIQTTQPFLDVGNGVGMYDALREKFSKHVTTTRHNSIESFIAKWINPIPTAGTNWGAEYDSIDSNCRAFKSACKDLSVSDLIDEFALFTLMHRIDKEDPFHLRMVAGVKDEQHKWSSIRRDLVHHMEVQSKVKTGRSSIQHANLTRQSSPNSSRGPSPLPPIMSEGDDNEHVNASYASGTGPCWVCGGPHTVATCHFVKVGQQLYQMKKLRRQEIIKKSFSAQTAH